MGALIFPSAGTIYLDSNAFIYMSERIEPYASLLDPVWDATSSGATVVASVVVLTETLAKPLESQDTLLLDVYRDLLIRSTDVRLFDVDATIAHRAAELRARHRLRTADALHAATALEVHSDLFVTNDPVFRRVASLPVVLLSDVASG